MNLVLFNKFNFDTTFCVTGTIRNSNIITSCLFVFNL